jgi:hypothetical protein
MEALVTGLTDEALLGRVWGGRRVFLFLLWQGTSLSLLVWFYRLAVFSSCLGCLLIFFVVGFKVKFITHLPLFLVSILLSKETCIGEKRMALKKSVSTLLYNFSNTLLKKAENHQGFSKNSEVVTVPFLLPLDTDGIMSHLCPLAVLGIEIILKEQIA